MCPEGNSGFEWFLNWRLNHPFSPEDILSYSRESGDILIVDNIRVQGRLRHQIGPG